MINTLNTMLGLHPMNDSQLGVNCDVASLLAAF